MSLSLAIVALQYELVSPEGTQEGKECHVVVTSLQLLPTLSKARESSGCENTVLWPQIAAMHQRKMSVGPDSCIFPCVEKC